MPEPLRRLSWGCGPVALDGWEGSDVADHGQSHVGDIRDGLPWPDGTFNAVASNHALQMLPWPDLVPALTELRRVTALGGWLRLLVPDLLLGVRSFYHRDAAVFLVSDEIEESLDGKLCVWITQAGSTRSVFTPGWTVELLRRAGWLSPRIVPYGITRSGDPELVALDSRPDESLIAEAVA